MFSALNGVKNTCFETEEAGFHFKTSAAQFSWLLGWCIGIAASFTVPAFPVVPTVMKKMGQFVFLNMNNFSWLIYLPWEWAEM